MPDDPDRPGPDDLVTPFLFVPHGSPDPVEWKRQHPGWVSFPATFVPHPKPIPKWKIINGQRWPLDKRGRPWPKTRFGRPTCPFDKLPPGFPAPGMQYELMRKLENPTLFWEGEPMPTVAEVLAIGERSRAERAAAAPPPPIEPQRAYDGDGFGPARDYLNAMRIVDQQLREFAASARQEKAARQERVDEQDTAPPERIDYDLLVTPDMTDVPPLAEPSGADPARALVAGGTTVAVGPAIPGALSQGALGRAAAGLLGAAAARATLLGGLLWPSTTGDSTLAGTGLTLNDAPGFDQSATGATTLSTPADETAGLPNVVTVDPSSPSLGPDPSSITPRPDVPPQAGGRGGQDVKGITGPPSSAIPSPTGDRIYITDEQGRVVLDVDRNRVKIVLPGRGYKKRGKTAPTPPGYLDLIDKVFEN